MKFESMSDAELISRLKNHREIEKESAANVLEYLVEVEARDLHLARGFSSIYEFLLEELGYSKDESYLRLRAMQLFRAVPEVKQKIVDGTMTLSSAASVQIALRKENRTRRVAKKSEMNSEEIREVVARVETASVRNSDRVLATIFPDQRASVERTKPIDAERTLIQFAVSQEQLRKFDELKRLLSHSNFDNRWDVLFEQLADIALKKLAKKADAKLASSLVEESSDDRLAPSSEKWAPVVEESESRMTPERDLPVVDATGSGSVSARSSLSGDALKLSSERRWNLRANRRRYISVQVRRQVFKNAGYRCEYVDAATGRRCETCHALQVDHVKLLALGGTDDISNLRALCAEHNRFSARRAGFKRRRVSARSENLSFELS